MSIHEVFSMINELPFPLIFKACSIISVHVITMSLFLIMPRVRHYHILTLIMNNAVKQKFAKDVISKINECLSKCAQILNWANS